jgi:hypothetical protein
VELTVLSVSAYDGIIAYRCWRENNKVSEEEEHVLFFAMGTVRAAEDS